MKRIGMVMFFIAVLAFIGCGDKTPQPPTADPAATTANPAGAAAPVAGQPAAAALPDIPADQSEPERALYAFFSALNVALDPNYQQANRSPEAEPEKARRYQEARARLRGLFVSGMASTAIVAYLDLIKMKKTEVIGKPAIDGNKATMKVRILKGDNLPIDPMSFGEEGKTEATVTVKMLKMDGNWKIEDFGGLVAKAKAQQG